MTLRILRARPWPTFDSQLLLPTLRIFHLLDATFVVQYASVMLHPGAAAADFWLKVGFAGPPSSASKDNSSGAVANLAAVVLRSKVWGPGYPVWVAKLPSPEEQPVSSGKDATGSGSFLMLGLEVRNMKVVCCQTDVGFRLRETRSPSFFIAC